MAIISKKQMSEEDIKLQYITPALTDKWDIQKSRWKQILQMGNKS